MCECESIVTRGEPSVVTFPVSDSAVGSFDIKDGRTGARVALPFFEVRRTAKEQYNRGIYSDDQESTYDSTGKAVLKDEGGSEWAANCRV